MLFFRFFFLLRCSAFLKKEIFRRASPSNGGWRLPSENEWEYAFRGGKGIAESFYGKMSEIAWFGESGTRQVGQKKANDLGLFDMYGNLFEWTSTINISDEKLRSQYEFLKKVRESGKKGAVATGGRPEYVVKGGSWKEPKKLPNVRWFLRPNQKSDEIGFRICRTVSKEK